MVMAEKRMRKRAKERREAELAADALDGQTARTILAGVEDGSIRLIDGEELDAQLAALMDE